ncbi:MAG: hypothetical protein ABWY93_02885 [Mycobacterium sp.]
MRHTFGGDIASYTIDLGTTETTTRNGLTGLQAIVVGGQLITFWNAETGGEQYTDLLMATTGGPDDTGGDAVTSVYSSPGADGDPPVGSIPMLLGPENITVMWAQVGAGDGGDTDPVDSTDPITEPDLVETDEDGNPIEDPGTEDPADDGEDPTEAGASSTPSGRLMIIASTAGYALRDELEAFKDDINPRVTDLEARADSTDTHLQVHDDQITELQGRTGGGTGGGGGGGLVTGTTAERPAPTVGALFLDYTKNRLWIGLKDVQGNPVWAPPPGTVVFKARTTEIMTMNDSGLYPLTWDTVDFDLLSGWLGTRPTRYVPSVPGYYRLDGAVGFSGATQANPRSVRYVQWRINTVIPPSATAVYSSTVSYTMVLPARSYSFYFNGRTDYVELCAYHNADVPLTTSITAFGQPGINITYQGGFGDAD